MAHQVGSEAERKVAFVTGASRGIGKASAIALAEAGYDVVVTARTMFEGEQYDYGATQADSGRRAMPGSIERTAGEIRGRNRRALPLRLDLLDRASVDAAIDKALATWGQIDVLLNNGIYQGPGLMDRFLDLPEDAVRRVFEGNVFAQVHIIQRVLPTMLARGTGIVINMSSAARRTDPPRVTGDGGWGFAYGASKGAFHRLAAILHLELNDRGICAYNIDPGYVVTEAQLAILGGDNAIHTRLRHRGAPPEVPATVIAWLATAPAAAELSGQTIDAQPFCKERQLLPGWPTQPKLS